MRRAIMLLVIFLSVACASFNSDKPHRYQEAVFDEDVSPIELEPEFQNNTNTDNNTTTELDIPQYANTTDTTESVPEQPWSTSLSKWTVPRGATLWQKWISDYYKDTHNWSDFTSSVYRQSDSNPINNPDLIYYGETLLVPTALGTENNEAVENSLVNTAELKAQIQSLLATVSTLQAQVSTPTEEVLRLTTENENLRNEVSKLSEDLANTRMLLDKVQDSYKEKRDEYTALQIERDNLQNSVQELSEESNIPLWMWIVFFLVLAILASLLFLMFLDSKERREATKEHEEENESLKRALSRERELVKNYREMLDSTEEALKYERGRAASAEEEIDRVQQNGSEPEDKGVDLYATKKENDELWKELEEHTVLLLLEPNFEDATDDRRYYVRLPRIRTEDGTRKIALPDGTLVDEGKAKKENQKKRVKHAVNELMRNKKARKLLGIRLKDAPSEDDTQPFDLPE